MLPRFELMIRKCFIPKDKAESYNGNVLNLISEYDLRGRYQNEPFMKYAESGTIENDMNKLEEALDSQEKEEQK